MPELTMWIKSYELLLGAHTPYPGSSPGGRNLESWTALKSLAFLASLAYLMYLDKYYSVRVYP